MHAADSNHPIDQHELTWSTYALNAGWQRLPSGEWQRPAHGWEPSNTPDCDQRLIRVSEAIAACEWDGLGIFGDHQQQGQVVPETDSRPVVTRMAEACITINAEQPAGVTRPALLDAGFSADEIDTHFADASLRARRLFLKDITESRAEPEPVHRIRARMRVAVGELLPSRQFIVSQLQADGFTKTQIDAHLREAIDRAGKDFSGLAVPPCIREVA